MANSSLTLTSLDFDLLKNNLKSYLSTQSIFKDYNFEGSNMNVLLDVMSYNTYLNSFYLNMVASEMFLDSAQKLDSVISHAKELNYIPQSAKSAESSISFTVQANLPSNQLVIPRGTKFSGTNSNNSFIFTTDSDTFYVSTTGTYTVANLQILEGTFFQDTYIINANVDTQSFVLSNPNIDTDSLVVTVTENSVNTNFIKVQTLFNLNSTSNVFFLQAAQNGQYEIVFGDGLFGRIPINGALVSAKYRISNGPAADGITSFHFADDIGALNGAIATVSDITVTANSSGGASAETIESIRFNAPRYFATQQRAISSDDYKSLIIANFGGDISDVAVYGGETLTPKQYGRVVLSLKPNGSVIASDYVKNEVSSFLLPYISLPNRVIISDPDYFYCGVTTAVNFNQNSTTFSPSTIQSMVSSTILNYSKNNLEKFGSIFRYSKFIADIDNTDSSILSNSTSITLIKRLAPLLNSSTSFSINFNNELEYETHLVSAPRLSDEASIISSPFTYVDSNGVETPNSYIRDDNQGLLVVYSYTNSTLVILNQNIGTVNYKTGQVQINNLTTSSYDNYISIYATVFDSNISVNKNQILLIDSADVNISAIAS